MDPVITRGDLEPTTHLKKKNIQRRGRKGLLIGVLFFFLSAIMAAAPSPSYAKTKRKSASSQYLSKEDARKKRKPKKKRRVRLQSALVRADGSAVYQGKSFDAPIIAYKKSGDKVRISRKLYLGLGGFGSFYMIRLNKSKYGYISDIDVVPKYSRSENSKKLDDNPEYEAVTDERDGRRPIYFTRFLGVNLGSTYYTETIGELAYGADTWLVGVKLSGPGNFMGGMPLDFELNVHWGVPAYYEELGFSQAEGAFALGHVAILFEAIQGRSMLAYYGLGGMFSYTSFELELKGRPLSSQEFRLGGIGLLGYSYRIKKKFLIKAEAKYYFEKEKYYGFSAAIQREF